MNIHVNFINIHVQVINIHKSEYSWTNHEYLLSSSWIIFSLGRVIGDCSKVIHYILNTPNCVCCWGALREALRLSPSTVRVSAGSITPSSHNLETVLYVLHVCNINVFTISHFLLWCVSSMFSIQWHMLWQIWQINCE